MPFVVDHNAEHEEHAPGTVTDMRDHLHEKLDQLIERMLEYGGAECLVETTGDGERTVIRLTLCDYTDELPCVFCDGTGIQQEITEQ